MSTIRAVPAEPITPTSTVFATPESTPRTSTSPPVNPTSPQSHPAPAPPPIASPPPGAQAAQVATRTSIPPSQQPRRSTSISASPPPPGAAPALSFNPASVTSQPVASGVVDILIPTVPACTIRAYSCSPNICVIDYPPTCDRDEAIVVATTLHDDTLRATLAVAGVVGEYAPHLAETLVPQLETLPAPKGRREVVNPRLGRGQFESRAAPLPTLVRRGTDVYAVQWANGPKPFVMDFKTQNVGMDPKTGEEEREMLSMLVVVLRQAVARGQLEAAASSRSSEEKIKEKAVERRERDKSEDVGNSCKCVVM